MRFTPAFLGTVLLATAVQAIYPDDHWSYSTKLSADNFDEVVKGAVDSGKTLVAPAWNAIVKEFDNNPDVVFADCNLRDCAVRGPPHNPGAGGWPTVRYFNAATGYDGQSYAKKTGKAMCDELGDKSNMRAAVDDAIATNKVCEVANPTEVCGEKEQKYISTWQAKTPAEVTSQLARLTGMSSGKMAPHLVKWVNQRINILKQLDAAPAAVGHDEL